MSHKQLTHKQYVRRREIRQWLRALPPMLIAVAILIGGIWAMTSGPNP